MIARAGVLAIFLVLTNAMSIGQQKLAQQTNDVLAQVFQRMTGGAEIRDVTLIGTAIRGTDQNSPAMPVTLRARGYGEARIDFNFSKGIRAEILKGAELESAPGAWLDESGVYHPIAIHNSWAPAVWFFPPLGPLSRLSDPNYVFTYIGRESQNGTSVQHFRASLNGAGRDAASTTLIKKLSTVDLYLDSTSLLPISLRFMQHPDDNASVDIEVEIRFSDYRREAGILFPHRVTRLLNGSAALQLVFTQAQFNTGLSSAEFSAQ